MAKIGELLAVEQGTGYPIRTSSVDNAATIVGTLTVNPDVGQTTAAIFGGDVSISGNLNVSGDIISGGTVDVVTLDNFIDLSNGYSDTTSKAGGLTINTAAVASTVILAATYSLVFLAGTKDVSNARFSIGQPGNPYATGSTTFSPGDVIQIAGLDDTLAENAGVFVVQSVADGTDVSGAPDADRTTIQVAGLLTTQAVNAPFAQNQFTDGTSTAGIVSRISIAVIGVSNGVMFRDNAPTYSPVTVGTITSAYSVSSWVRGAWGSSPPGGRNELFYYNVIGGSSLQSAYENGNTIDATFPFGSIAFTLDSSGGAVDFTVDSDGSGGSVLFGMTESLLSFQVDASGVITLDSADSTGSAILLQASNATGGINLIANTGGVTVDTSGSISLDASGASVSSNFTVFGSDQTLTVEALGGGTLQQLILTSAGADVSAVVIQATDVSGGIDINAQNGGITVDAIGSISVDSSGSSNFTVTSTNTTLTLAALGGGATQQVSILSDGGDVSAVAIIAQDTSGGVLIQSGLGGIDIDGDTGQVYIHSNEATPAAVRIHAEDASSATTVQIDSSGTGTSAIDINSAGGITIDADGIISIDASGSASTAANFTLTYAGASDPRMVIDSIATGVGQKGIIEIGTASENHDIFIGGLSGENFISMTTDTGGVYVYPSTSTVFNGTWIYEDNANINITTTTTGTDAQNLINIGGKAVVLGYSTTLSSPTAAAGGTPLYQGPSNTGIVGEAGEALVIGDVVMINAATNPSSSSQLQFIKALASSATLEERRALGVVVTSSASALQAVIVATVAGTTVFATTSDTPVAGDVGKPVFLDDTVAGEVTLTPPSASNRDVFQLGYLLSSTLTSGRCSIVLAPQFITRIP